MLKTVKSMNEALPVMYLLDIIYLVLGEVIILIVFPEPAQYAVGFLAGVLYAVFASYHLGYRIHRVVYGQANTTRTLVIGYFVRLLVMVALFAVLYYFNIGDLIAALIGMFAMKISAYLQPSAAKFVQKLKKRG